jgi:hypothetical protein
MTDDILEEHWAIIEYLRAQGHSAKQIANYLITQVHISVPHELLMPRKPTIDKVIELRQRQREPPPLPVKKKRKPRKPNPKRVPDRNWFDFLPGEVARPQTTWSKRNRILAAVRNGARKQEIAKFLRLSRRRIYQMYNQAVRQEKKRSPLERYLKAPPPVLSKRERRSLHNYPLVPEVWEWEHLL